MHISINIDVDDPKDKLLSVAAALDRLAATWQERECSEAQPVVPSVHPAGRSYSLTEDARPGYPEPEIGAQPDAPKRVRRTKAEMEVAKAVEAPAAELPSEPVADVADAVTKQDVLNAVGAASVRGVAPLAIQEALIKNFQVERVGKLAEDQFAGALAIFSKL